jgi:kynurenine formamidase
VRLVDLSHPWGVETPPFIGLEFPAVVVTHRFATHNTFMTRVSTSMHCGTHIDAPRHFVEGGADMASMPLDTFFGEGVIVDLRGEVAEWDVIRPEQLTRRVEIKPGDIVVYYTGWSRYYHYGDEPDERKFILYQPGGGPELAQWIVDMKLRWTGMDTCTPEHPMLNPPFRLGRPELVAEYERRTGCRVDEAFPLEQLAVMHKVPFAAGIVHVENVGGDVETILDRRVKLAAFPWKFVGGDASICRLVAFVDE